MQETVAVAPLIGLAVGLVVGTTSTGGGALLAPALVLVLRVPASVAVGTDVLIATVTKLFGGAVYARRGHVHWRTVWTLAAGSLPGAVAGLVLLDHLPPALIEDVMRRAVGGALILAGSATLVRLWLGRSWTPAAPGRAWTIAAGGLTGLLVSVTSIGSGSLLLCVLASFPLPAQTIVGTDLLHALLLSSAASAGHLLAGRVDVPLAASVLAGSIPGALIGARLAHVLPERALRAGLAVLLVALGVPIAWPGVLTHA